MKNGLYKIVLLQFALDFSSYKRIQLQWKKLGKPELFGMLIGHKVIF